MFGQATFLQNLSQYKKDFNANWSNEKFKWVAVKTFRDNWDIDAPDFAEMLGHSLRDAESTLLISRGFFPALMIKRFAERYPDRVREMFRRLFDERVDFITRIMAFTAAAQRMGNQYYKEIGKNGLDYQDAKTVSTYLFLRYPEKYYLFSYHEASKCMKILGGGVVERKYKRMELFPRAYRCRTGFYITQQGRAAQNTEKFPECARWGYCHRV